ncbi:hypothetical protein PVAP13_1NG431238 [Panicum virgatum]|uniref:Uncharacterized protein n=1 Tax=Panicum virgatum TaxID=38727 RepID=A0A8T0X3B6_PANVG|nr:hypothetical protein PVAP13_1NG431238 [Panicum virgatum]
MATPPSMFLRCLLFFAFPSHHGCGGACSVVLLPIQRRENGCALAILGLARAQSGTAHGAHIVDNNAATTSVSHRASEVAFEAACTAAGTRYDTRCRTPREAAPAAAAPVDGAAAATPVTLRTCSRHCRYPLGLFSLSSRIIRPFLSGTSATALFFASHSTLMQPTPSMRRRWFCPPWTAPTPPRPPLD